MRLLLVPPDVRPPTYDFPVKLAQAAGLEVLTPPPEALPDLNQPGKADFLKRWLLEHTPKADVLIISLETLCLGGMIPARRVEDSFEEAVEKLELLCELKTLNPDLRIYVGGVVVRVAHGNDPLEEKTYYGEWGDALRDYSEWFDRFARSGKEEDKGRLEQAKTNVPQEILDDWLATRRRNHQLHLRALELTHEGVIEHICLTLDDTSTYGLAANDRRALEAKTDELKLWQKVDIYPGADEVPATLLARAVQEKPSKVYVRCSGSLGAAASLIFEDRPVGELVTAQLRAARCVQVDTLAEADFVLAVNTPAIGQAEPQPNFESVDTAVRYLPAFIDFLEHCLADGIPVALADIAYPNGAERRLMTLVDELPLNRLAGYGAWNTAGNTLGGVIAMGVVSGRIKNRALWFETLFNRFVDDYLYQAEVRAAVASQLVQSNPFDLGPQKEEAETLLEEKMQPLARAFWDKHFAQENVKLIWKGSRLAWPRLFTGVFPFRVE